MRKKKLNQVKQNNSSESLEKEQLENQKTKEMETAKTKIKTPWYKRSKIPKGDCGVTKEVKELFTQDLVPVEDIVNGMYKLKKKYGGGYVKVVEIEPTNFWLKTDSERIEIISEMRQWLKIAPNRLQFHMTTTKADTSELIMAVYNKTKNETDKKVLERRDKYIEKLKSISKSEGLAKKFYIVYKYEGSENGISTDLIEITETMYQTQGYISYYFQRMGNSIVEHENDNIFLANLLYKELNPKSCINESFNERLSRIIYDQEQYAICMRQNFDSADIPVDDILATRGVNDSNSSYVKRDGMFSCCLYIKKKGYRHNVQLGWMESFTSFGEGVTLNIYTVKQNKHKAEEQAGRTKRLKKSELNTGNVTDDNEDILMSGVENAAYVRSALVDGDEDLYDVFIMLTLTAKTNKELLTLKNKIKKMLSAKDFHLADTNFHNEEALLMSLPMLIINPQLFSKGRRNMLTTNIASTYIFTAFELYDPNGILLGINAVNSSLAVQDFFDRRKYKNGNTVITGSSGMGKTYFLQQLGYAFRTNGIPVYYILPHKGFEYFKACKEIGGEFIPLSPGSKACVNIMAIRPQQEVDMDMLDDDEMIDESLLSKKIHQLITFVQLLKPKEVMTDAEETQMNIVLTHLYNDFGITDDNESIWENKEKRTVKFMPIIGDMYDRFCEDEILKDRIAIALRPFVEGSCVNMNGQTNVELNNKFTIFDVSNAGKQFLAAFAFIAIDCSYDFIKMDRSELCALIMDEVWRMMINLYSAEFVMEIYKIIRGYGGIAISATQDISDFLSYEEGRYGKKIITNSKIKFLLGAEKAELEELTDCIDITPDEVIKLSKYDRGQALMIANGEKVPIFIKGTDEETAIFTTDAQTLKKLKEKNL